MENLKWQNVLIEWVNCLKLSKNIQCLEDLRSGEFFSNLQKVITKSSNPEKDTLTFIFDILTAHYPDYVIENRSDVHLADLPAYDLKAVVSLLMHYTCIYDRRDVLTSPLCHSLSQNNQIMIRHYLQNITAAVNNADLERIVSGCIQANQSSESPSLHWLSGGSANSNESPLQNILSTPVSRMGRFQEKEKRIARLESELEMEKYEKCELQEQLNLYMTKHTNLETILEQKNSEISGLRLEITELENRTPPHYQDTDARMTQKRLRMEIENLEMYVNQLETEEGKLRDEKDAAKEKVKKLEFECGMWQEKFFTSEKALEIITEQSKTQESQLASLKTLCDELTAMLNERKRLSAGNVDESFQASPLKSAETTLSCENLAHSVVEVQLKDAQKELTEVNMKLNRTQERCKLLENEKQKLFIELDSKNETLEQTLEELQSCHKEIAEMGIKMISQSKDLSSLNEKLIVVSDQLLIKETDISVLKDKISTMESDFAKKEAFLVSEHSQKSEKLLEKENIVNSLTMKLEELSSHYQELVEELNNVKLSKEETDEEYNYKLNKQGEDIKMFVLLLENTKSDLHEKELLADSLKNDNEKLENSLTKVESECRDLESRLNTVREENANMKENICKLENELISTRGELADKIIAHNDLAKLEEAKANEIEDLKNDIAKSKEHESIIREQITKLETEVFHSIHEHSEIHLEENNTTDAIECFENCILQMRQNTTHLKDLLSEKEVQITKQESNIVALHQKVADLQEQLDSELAKFKNEMAKSEEKIMSQSNTLSSLSEKFTATTENLTAKEIEISALKEEMGNLNTDFSVREMSLNAELSEKNEELVAKVEIIDELTKKLEELTSHHQDTLERLSSAQSDNQVLNQDLFQCRNELNDSEKRISSLEEELSSIKLIKEDIKRIFNDNLKKHADQITRFSLLIMNTKSALHEKKLLANSLKDDNEKLKNSFTKVQSQCKDLESQLNTVKEQNTDMEENIHKVKNELISTRGDLEDKIISYNELTKLEQTKDNEIEALKNNIAKSKEHESIIREQVIKLETVVLHSLHGHSEIHLEDKNTIDAIKCFENCILQMQQNTTHLEDLLCENELHITEQESNIVALTKKITDLQEQLDSELAKFKNEIAKSEEKMVSQSNTLSSLSEKFTATTKDLTIKEIEISALKEEIGNLNSDFSVREMSLNAELSEKNKELVAKVEIIDELTTKLEELTSHHQDTLEQLNSAQSDNQVLNQDLFQCRNDLSNSEKHISSLEKELSSVELIKEGMERDFNDNVRKHEDEVKTVTLLLEQTEFSLREQKALNIHLKSTNEELTASLAAVDKQCKDLEEELTLIKQDKSNLLVQICKLEDELVSVKEDLENKITAYNKLKAFEEERDKEIEAFKNNVAKSEEHNSAIKEEIFMLEKELLCSLVEQSEVQLAEKSTTDTIKCLRNHLMQVQKTKDDLNGLLNEKNMEIRKQENEIINLTQAVTELRAQQESEREKFSNELANLRETVVCQSNELSLLNEKLTVSTQELLAKDTEISTLKDKLLNLERKETSLNNNLAAKADKLLAEEKMVEDLTRKLKDLSISYQAVEEQLSCAQTEIQHLSQELHLRSNDLAKSIAAVSSFEKELAALKQAKEENERDLNDNLETCEEKLNVCTSLLETTEASLREQELLNNSLQNSNEELTVSLARVEDQCRLVEEELASIKQQNSHLQDKLLEFEEELVTTRGELASTCKEMTTLQEEKDKEIDTLKCDIVKLKDQNLMIEEGITRLEKVVLGSLFEQSAVELGEKRITDVIKCLESHILQMQKTKSNLNELLDEKDVNMRKHEIEVANLTQKIVNLQEQQNAEIESLKNELAKSEKNHSVIEEEAIKLQKNVLNVLNKFAGCSITLDKSNTVDILRSIAEHISELKEKTINLDSLLYDKDSNLRKQECKVANLTQKISELQEQHASELQNVTNKLAKLEETNSIMEQAIVKLENQLLLIFIRNSEAVSENELAEKPISKIIVSLENLIGNLVENKTNMERLITDEKERVQLLTSEVAKLKEDNIKLEEITSESALVIKKLESETNNLSQKLAVLQQEREQHDMIIKEEIVKLRGILSFLLSGDKRRSECNESCIGIIKSMENDIEIIRREKTGLEESIAEKSATIMKQQTEIRELLQKIDNLAHHQKILENRLEKHVEDSVREREKLESHYSILLDEHKSTFENLKTVSEKVTTEMNNCKIENQILQEELAVTVKEKQKLDALLKDCEFDYNKTREESKLHEDEYTKIRRKHAELEKAAKEDLETIKTLRERNLKLESDIQNLTEDLMRVSTSRNELLESQTKMIEETENNVLRAHENAIEVKNDLTRQLESLETQVESENSKKKQIQDELNSEIKRRQQIETDLMKVSNDYNQLKQVLQEAYSRCISNNHTEPSNIEEANVIEKFKEYIGCVEANLKKLEDSENESCEMKRTITTLQEDYAKIVHQKEEETMALESLQTDYDLLVSKYNQIIAAKDILEGKYHVLQQRFESLQKDHELLLAKFNQVVSTRDRFEEEYNLLQAEHESLINKVEALSPKDCTSFLTATEVFKKKLEVIFSQRNMLESLLGSMRMTMLSVQQNMNRITIPAFTFKQIFEKKEALEIIMEDICKHSSRITKQSNELVFKLIRLYDKCLEQLANNGSCLEESNSDQNQTINDIVERITDLNDRTSDALEQLKALNKEIENILQKQELKATKDKENVLTTSNKLNQNVEKFKEDEWRKKNMMLKQKLTLSENAKSNLEKKLRHLQEENKKLTSQQPNIEGDAYYKMLLQDHMAVKEDHERALQECQKQYKQLREEHGELKKARRAHTEVLAPKDELLKVQQAYEEALRANSKHEVEIVSLRQIIEERNVQITELNQVKEAYEKLLEENNKLMTEVDTLKYKRTRDRDEFVRLLKKDRDEMEVRETKRIQQIRAEYEKKLEKMKNKMLQLYKEEINKEMDRVKSGHDQYTALLNTIENLRSDVFEAEQKISFLEAERDVLKSRQCQPPEPSFFLSRESLCSSDFKFPEPVARNPRDRDSIRSISSQITRRAIEECNPMAALETNNSTRKTNTSSSIALSETQEIPRFEDRRVFTLPRSTGMNVIEEITVTKRRSISGVPANLGQNLQMEDEEDDCFNNKYLADLKEGRCNAPDGDNTNRFSELAWRNSMQPPHLKSSYPAELQFISPSQFKEDDIKTGNIEMDNSLSKLLPGEKPRKKDFGTTSYKKPGPPTPSKNGGRLSLQGNEIHPLREYNMETKTPKRTTPNRIKALFMGKVNSIRDNSENQSSPKKRVSFFRKPK